ncbi:MAG: ASCH domain-containing protein [Spirochaetota bacterium]
MARGWKSPSVQNPWSYLICRGIKDVENRSWPTDYRRKLCIHSSGRPMDSAEARSLGVAIPEQLQAVTELQRRRAQEEARQRQQTLISAEIEKLDYWIDDLKNWLELRIKELEVAIKETKEASTLVRSDSWLT